MTALYSELKERKDKVYDQVAAERSWTDLYTRHALAIAPAIAFYWQQVLNTKIPS